jgi:hypothetical protein
MCADRRYFAGALTYSTLTARRLAKFSTRATSSSRRVKAHSGQTDPGTGPDRQAIVKQSANFGSGRGIPPLQNSRHLAEIGSNRESATSVTCRPREPGYRALPEISS